MSIDLDAIKARLAAVSPDDRTTSAHDVAALLAEVERLAPLVKAADAWARAIAEPNGVFAAEITLLAEVRVWRQNNDG